MEIDATNPHLPFAGLYGAGEEGLTTLHADIRHVCALWASGCRRRASRFAAEMADGNGSAFAEGVEARLESLFAAAVPLLLAAEAGVENLDPRR